MALGCSTAGRHQRWADGRDVHVLGGANSAGQAALHLAQHARSVTLVVRANAWRGHVGLPGATDRGDAFDRGPAGNGDRRRRGRWLARSSWCFETARPQRGEGELRRALPHDRRPPANRLAAGRDRAGRERIRSDRLRPDNDGSWPLEREPLLFETGMPGVLAVGDVRHGSSKRVASAVGDGSVAIQMIHRLFDMGGHQPLGRTKQRSKPDEFARDAGAQRRAAQDPAHQLDRARLVERLVQVAALRALDARRASRRARALGDQAQRVADQLPNRSKPRSAMPTPPGWPS